jgi:hypothetical protein
MYVHLLAWWKLTPVILHILEYVTICKFELLQNLARKYVPGAANSEYFALT